ncbi:aldolase/citrate lyase family protein [Nocardia sp. NPDC002869]|uniref:aldolase/citrate lyase family protein n=1 Tax=Nocardia sp. NPDC002869 TaxID=3161032 RepID=UPI00398CFDD0
MTDNRYAAIANPCAATAADIIVGTSPARPEPARSLGNSANGTASSSDSGRVYRVRHDRLEGRRDRGFATYGRAGRYGTRTAADHLAADARETLVIAMVGSTAGCRHPAVSVATPGIDGVMVGPADLAVSMGTHGPADPAVPAEIEKVHAAVAAHERIRLDIVSSEQRAAAAFDSGAGLVVINLTQVLMKTFARLRSVR